MEVGKRIGLTRSYDHRIVDGVIGNEFAEYAIEAIEDLDVFVTHL